MECLETLTQQAISRSSEIEAINEQLALTAERQDYAEARWWTNYLTFGSGAAGAERVGGWGCAEGSDCDRNAGA